MQAFKTAPGSSVAAVCFGLMSVFLIGMNVAALIASTFCKRHSSPVPFLGGIFGGIALLALPFDSANYFFWVPFALDPGSLFVLVGLLIFLAKRPKG